MRLQSSPNGCGPAAVANALRALGREMTEERVEKKIKAIADTGDPAVQTGTIEAQIAKALAAFRVPATQLQLHHPIVALMALRGFLWTGHPVLLAVDNDEHWVVATGVRGGWIDVVDSANGEVVIPYRDQELANRWAASGEVPSFYGIAVGKGLK